MKVFFLCALVAVATCTAYDVDVYPTADMTTTPEGAAAATAYIEICYRPAHGHPDTRGSMLFELDEYSGWTAQSAMVNVNVFYQSGCGLPTSFHTYAATEAWDENWTSGHVTHSAENWGTFTFNGVNTYQLDVTDLVNAWLSGSIDNFGLVFQSIDNNQAEHRFYSVNASSESVRPFLSLSFPEAFSPNTWAGIKSSL